MEPEAKYTVVGSVVLLLVALIAATVVWLRSSGEGADARPYRIYFERQSLEGLEPRSTVTMRGVRVGTVTGLRFSSRRPGAVEVTIAVDPTTPVRTSTHSVVDRHLVTGLASVRLENTSEDAPLLVDAPPDERYPVIVEGESTMEQVSATLNQLAQRTDKALRQIETLLSPENQAALAATLQNLRRVSQHADATLAKVDSAVGSFAGAADEVRALARSVAADARQLSARYEALGADASVSMREAGDAVRKMGADVERLSRRAEALLAGGDEELRATSSALRAAADAVGSAAERLRDPRQLILGPADGSLGPGEGVR